MSDKAQLILASASPRRFELLQQMCVRSLVQAVDIDETKKIKNAKKSSICIKNLGVYLKKLRVEHVNITIFTIVGTINLINAITQNKPLWQYFAYVLPFLILLFIGVAPENCYLYLALI